MISKDILAKKQQKNISEKKVNFSDWYFQLFLKGKKNVKTTTKTIAYRCRTKKFPDIKNDHLQMTSNMIL